MANRTNLSSWGNLRDYLKTNVDPDKDWDNEDIKDYSALLGAQAAGKVSGDKFTEGRNLFQHYLADAQATDVYQQAQAKAENEARRETAYGNYLSTRLGSYLREIQGNAGIAGYGGLTQGQAIAVKNDQENAFRAVQESKKSAIQGYLDTYQGALANNSATAIDQATALDAAKEARKEDKKLAVQEYVQQYLDNTDTDSNGMYSKEVATKVKEYIANSGLSPEEQEEVEKTISFVNGDSLPQYTTDEEGNEVEVKTETQQANAEKQWKDKVYSIQSADHGTIAASKEADARRYALGEINATQWNELKSEYDKREKVLYKSEKRSGGISEGNTATLKFTNGSGGKLGGDDATFTLGTKSLKSSEIPSIAQGFAYGQVFIWNDTLYVKGWKDRAYNIAHTTAYNKIKNVIKDTYYDLDSRYNK